MVTLTSVQKSFKSYMNLGIPPAMSVEPSVDEKEKSGCLQLFWIYLLLNLFWRLEDAEHMKKYVGESGLYG